MNADSSTQRRKGAKSEKVGRLLLTALYRSHYYIERALGNLLGLAMLQDFVAKEAGIKTGDLVCISTMAVLDKDGIGTREIGSLLDRCNQDAHKFITGQSSAKAV